MEYLLCDEDYELLKDNIVPVPWLGFDHDSTKVYPVTTDIFEYAALQGCSQETLLSLQSMEGMKNASVKDFAALQAMLFFGVWEALLGEHIPSAKFICPIPDGVALRTLALRPILRTLYKDTKYKASEDPMSAELVTRAQMVRTFLSEIAMFSDWAATRMTRNNYDTVAALIRLFQLTIGSLGHFRTYLKGPTRSLVPSARARAFWWSDQLLEKLVQAGWCSSLVSSLAHLSCGLDGLEFFTALGSVPAMTKNVHARCTEGKCVAHNVHPSEFRAIHRPGCEGCEFAHVPMDRAEEILLQGKFFVVDIDALSSSSRVSEDALIPYHPGMEYVAISHVWSHGLGGHADEGLPRCQLQLLAEKLPRESETKRIWMDTLCIPVDQSLKMLSIERMAAVYKNARFVLALDSSLQNMNFQETSIERLAILTYMSDWNHRLWTFQEAYLAQKVYFVFKDGSFSMSAMEKRYRKTVSNMLLSHVFNRLLWTCASGRIPKDETFRAMWPALQKRQSSVPDDESLVVGNALGYDTGPLQTLSGEERWCAFWELMRSIPSAVIFSGTEKRCIMPGFGWAPRSLTGASFKAISLAISPGTSTIRKSGLEGDYIVLPLETRIARTSQCPAKQTLWFGSDAGLVVEFPRGMSNFEYDTLILPALLNPTDHHMPGVASLAQSSSSSEDPGIAKLKYQSIIELFLTEQTPGRPRSSSDIHLEAGLKMVNRRLSIA